MSAPVAAMHHVVSAGNRGHSSAAAAAAAAANGASTIVIDANGQRVETRLNKIVPLMSPNELERVSEVFQAFETGVNDGTMYPKDLSQALKMLGLNPTETEIQDLINEVEHNGLISFHDFCLVSIRKMRSDDDEDNFHQELFRVFVGPKNYAANVPAAVANISRELLSYQQFKTIMTQLPEAVTEGEAAKMFAIADRDANGRISFGEFRRMCLVARTEVAPEKPGAHHHHNHHHHRHDSMAAEGPSVAAAGVAAMVAAVAGAAGGVAATAGQQQQHYQ